MDISDLVDRTNTDIDPSRKFYNPLGDIRVGGKRRLVSSRWGITVNTNKTIDAQGEGGTIVGENMNLLRKLRNQFRSAMDYLMASKEAFESSGIIKFVNGSGVRWQPLRGPDGPPGRRLPPAEARWDAIRKIFNHWTMEIGGQMRRAHFHMDLQINHDKGTWIQISKRGLRRFLEEYLEGLNLYINIRVLPSDTRKAYYQNNTVDQVLD